MKLAVLLCLPIASCATMPTAPLPQPEPVVQIKEVDKPVPVPCLKMTDVPAQITYADSDEALHMAADIFSQVKLLLAGRIQRNDEEKYLRNVISSCAGLP